MNFNKVVHSEEVALRNNFAQTMLRKKCRNSKSLKKLQNALEIIKKTSTFIQNH